MRARAIVFACAILAALTFSTAAAASFMQTPSISALSSYGFPAALVDLASYGDYSRSSAPDTVASLNSSSLFSGFSSFSPAMSGMSAQMPKSFSLPGILESSALQPTRGSITEWAPSTVDSYGESSNGDTITIKLGDSIHVQLPARVDQGYMWNLSVTDGLNVTSERVYTPQQISSLFSGSGLSKLEVTQEWDITAIMPGTQVILAKYRSSADSGPYDKAFTLTVVVE
jgi:predicted secreted protein